jgi:hypothetical protein
VSHDQRQRRLGGGSTGGTDRVPRRGCVGGPSPGVGTRRARRLSRRPRRAGRRAAPQPPAPAWRIPIRGARPVRRDHRLGGATAAGRCCRRATRPARPQAVPHGRLTFRPQLWCWKPDCGRMPGSLVRTGGDRGHPHHAPAQPGGDLDRVGVGPADRAIQDHSPVHAEAGQPCPFGRTSLVGLEDDRGEAQHALGRHGLGVVAVPRQQARGSVDVQVGHAGRPPGHAARTGVLGHDQFTPSWPGSLRIRRAM